MNLYEYLEETFGEDMTPETKLGLSERTAHDWAHYLADKLTNFLSSIINVSHTDEVGNEVTHSFLTALTGREPKAEENLTLSTGCNDAYGPMGFSVGLTVNGELVGWELSFRTVDRVSHEQKSELCDLILKGSRHRAVYLLRGMFMGEDEQSTLTIKESDNYIRKLTAEMEERGEFRFGGKTVSYDKYLDLIFPE